MKILLFHYIGGGGGKFIANCLSSGFEVAFSNFRVAKQLLTSKDVSLLEQKLLATIPPNNKDKTWHDYEQGCWQLFGHDVNKLRNSINPKLVRFNRVDQLGDTWLPLMSHYPDEFTYIQNNLSQVQTFKVLVDATPEFIDSAIRLKWSKSDASLDLDIYRQFHNELPKFNFDFTITQWDPRIDSNLDQITQLAQALDVQINLNGIQNYIRRYQEFHR